MAHLISAHIPLARIWSHGHASLFRKLGDIVASCATMCLAKLRHSMIKEERENGDWWSTGSICHTDVIGLLRRSRGMERTVGLSDQHFPGLLSGHTWLFHGLLQLLRKYSTLGIRVLYYSPPLQKVLE